jgi:hypothetical protein
MAELLGVMFALATSEVGLVGFVAVLLLLTQPLRRFWIGVVGTAVVAGMVTTATANADFVDNEALFFFTASCMYLILFGVFGALAIGAKRVVQAPSEPKSGLGGGGQQDD